MRGAIHRGCAALRIFRVLLGNVLSNLPWSHSCSCSQEEVELEIFQASSELFSCDPAYLACAVIAGCLIEARSTLKVSYCTISVTKRFLPCTAIHFHSCADNFYSSFRGPCETWHPHRIQKFFIWTCLEELMREPPWEQFTLFLIEVAPQKFGAWDVTPLKYSSHHPV